MSTTTTSTELQKSTKKYVCSCGAEFAHGISLRRHQRVTGHTGEQEIDAEESAPEADADPIGDSATEVAPPLPAVVEPVRGIEGFVPRPASAFYPERQPEPETHTVVVIDVGRAILLFYAFSAIATKYAARFAGSFAETMGSAGRGAAQILVRSIPIALAILLLSTGLVSARGLARAMMQSTPADVRQVTPQEQAAVAVMGFFQSVEARSYPAAYNYLTDAWRAELPYTEFHQGFSRSHTVGCVIHGAHAVTPNAVQVQVSLDVLEGGGTTTYVGSYLVVGTPGGWRLDRGWMSRL
ncbi:MAG: hypothetical protein HY319_24620 [Armatimonadetes bacterium]|nr:hypothetical protein [Armatimonadota bacterium]